MRKAKGSRKHPWLVAVLAAAALVAPLTIRVSPATASPDPSGGALRARIVPQHRAGLDDSLLADAGLAPAGSVASRVQRAERDRAGRVVVYVEGTDLSTLKHAVTSTGGAVLGAVPGRVRAAVPPKRLADLAGLPGVGMVRRPDRAIEGDTSTMLKAAKLSPSLAAASVVSEGVEASGADKWIGAGRTGAGVKIGLIDVGFGGLDAAQAAAELPPTGSGLTLNTSNCVNPNADKHGTAAAEVIHDMAPDAQLFLACVEDSVGFTDAYLWLHQEDVKVYDTSMGFLTTGRGDGRAGTCAPALAFPAGSVQPQANTDLDQQGDCSPAGIVKTSRLGRQGPVSLSGPTGDFWVAAAGDQAQTHLGTTITDADGDHLLNLDPTKPALDPEVELDGFDVSAGHTATVSLRWDDWSDTNTDLDLYVMDQPSLPATSTDPHVVALGATPRTTTTGGMLPPTEQVTFTNDTAFNREYFIAVANNGTLPTHATSLDLSVSGAVTSMQFTSAARSLLEPATSPYAVTVGATQAGTGVVEPYSAQGPTIDGRAKPDITGFDQVQTSQAIAPGTGVAAAGVAGAAALALGVTPGLDVSVLQAMLEDQATHMLPPNININVSGHGTLDIEGGPNAQLDSTKVPTAPAGDGFTPLAVPQRILYTRTSVGDHPGKLTAGETYTLPLPPSVPADADAVAVSIVGLNATSATDLELSAETTTDATRYTSSTLNIGPNDTKYAGTIVRIGHDQFSGHSIRIRNAAGSIDVAVDLFGFFSPNSSSTYVPRAVPTRILDTGINVGGNFSASGGKLGSTTITVLLRGTGSVDPEIPAGATAVALNVGMLGSSADADVRVYPQDYGGTGTCHVPGLRVRECMVIVGIGTDGMIRVTNAGAGVRVVLDLAGWFVNGGGGQKYVPLHDQTRVLDTRSGNGLMGKLHGTTALGAEAASLNLAGLDGIPLANGTAMAGLVGVAASAHSWLGEMYNSVPDPGQVEYTVGMDAGEVNANGALVPISRLIDTGLTYTTNSASGSTVDAVMDVMGYFTPGPGGPLPADVALHQQASSSTVCATTQGALNAVDGNWEHSVNDKWCSLTTHPTLTVDLGVVRNISSVILFHSGAGGEPAAWNTRDYDIQVSNDNVTWTTAVQRRANTANITSDPVTATARYVRLTVLTPTQNTDTATRIYEMDVMGTS